MKQPLRILSAIDIPWNSGLAAYAFAQANALRGLGHEVVFACPENSAAMAFAAKEGFKHYAVPGRKEYHKVPLALLRLRAIARDNAIAVVAAHTGRMQTLGYLLGLPVVRVKADTKRPSAGFTFSGVTRVIAASAYIENLYAAAGLDRARVTLVRQGLALPRTPQRRASAPYRVGLLGRLDLVKGHAVLLRAARQLLRADLPVEFHIAGYEANLKYADLRREAEDLGIAKKVFFHGRTEGPFAFMESCDIGVVPSLGSEAVSRAAAEWLASGRPLVASAVGSLPEYAAPEWLVPPGDHLALAARLQALLLSPDAIALLGAANRARAERELSPAVFAEATEKVFKEAAGR
ncbi:MAG: glycosyltransferase [Elusimicrobiales bacterium]|nr:glycosyltransferase [Elusimicrobiales bacterium]